MVAISLKTELPSPPLQLEFMAKLPEKERECKVLFLNFVPIHFLSFTVLLVVIPFHGISIASFLQSLFSLQLLSHLQAFIELRRRASD